MSAKPIVAALTTEEMLGRYKAGQTMEAIARLAGVHVNTVRNRLRKVLRIPAEPTFLDVPAVPAPPPSLVIGAHAYTEHLGCEGRATYAADAYGDVWRLEAGRRREWFGRRSNWETSHAARRIASPRTLPSDWDRAEVTRRLEGERL